MIKKYDESFEKYFWTEENPSVLPVPETGGDAAAVKSYFPLSAKQLAYVLLLTAAAGILAGGLTVKQTPDIQTIYVTGPAEKQKTKIVYVKPKQARTQTYPTNPPATDPSVDAVKPEEPGKLPEKDTIRPVGGKETLPAKPVTPPEDTSTLPAEPTPSQTPQPTQAPSEPAVSIPEPTVTGSTEEFVEQQTT